MNSNSQRQRRPTEVRNNGNIFKCTQSSMSTNQPGSNMDNVRLNDNSVPLTAEVHQSGGQAKWQYDRQELVNRNSPFVGPISTTRTNAPFLPNFAFRQANTIGRIPQQSVIQWSNSQTRANARNSSKTTFIPTTNINLTQAGQKAEMNQLPQLDHMRQSSMMLRAVQSNILPPGGTFVVLDRNSGQEISEVPLHNTQQHMPAIRDMSALSFNTYLPTNTTASTGRCTNTGNPLLTINDYPSFKMKICGFNTLHKNYMAHMSDYFQSLYTPTFPAHSHTLFLGMNYMQVICIEVESTIMGEFICRLVPRLLETCSHPFVVELKEAANQWQQYMQKCFVVEKHNFESAARKISVVLKTRDTVLKEHAKLPELTLEFEFRRSYIGIKVVVCKHSHEKFLEDVIERFLRENARKKDVPKYMLFEELSQTERHLTLPLNLSDLYMHQLKVVMASVDRYNALIALEEEYEHRSITLSDDQNDLLEELEEKAAELLEHQKMRGGKLKTITDEIKKRIKISTGVNTEYYEYIPPNIKLEPVIDQYKPLYTDIIINHLKQMKKIFANQHILRSRIAVLKNQKKARFEGEGTSTTGIQEVEGHCLQDNPKEISSAMDLAVGVMLRECMDKFKEILIECRILTHHLGVREENELRDENVPKMDDDFEQTKQEVLEEICGSGGDEINPLNCEEFEIDALDDLDEFLMWIEESHSSF